MLVVFAATVIVHELAHAVAWSLLGAEDIRLRYGAVYVGDPEVVAGGGRQLAIVAGPSTTLLQALLGLCAAWLLIRRRTAREDVALIALWIGCVAAAHLAISAMAATADSDVGRLLAAVEATRGVRVAIASVGAVVLFATGIALRAGIDRMRRGSGEPLVLHAIVPWIVGVGLPHMLLLPPRDWPLAWAMGMFTLVVLIEPSGRSGPVDAGATVRSLRRSRVLLPVTIVMVGVVSWLSRSGVGIG